MTKQRKALDVVARVPVAADAEPLDRYFVELRRYPLLDAQQEISSARQIEALEVAHWCTLLSYRRALVPHPGGARGTCARRPDAA
jgi:hypothetical protein